MRAVLCAVALLGLLAAPAAQASFLDNLKKKAEDALSGGGSSSGGAATAAGLSTDQIVAGLVTERVVDGFEPVQVEIKDSEAPASSLELLGSLVEACFKGKPIGEISEWIMIGHVLDVSLRSEEPGARAVQTQQEKPGQ